MFNEIKKDFEEKNEIMQGIVFRGDYIFESLNMNGDVYEKTEEHNLITGEALLNFAKLIAEQGALGSWYVCVGNGTYTPNANETGSTVASAIGEFQGYSQTTRPLFTKNTITTLAEISNSDSPSIFTITEDVTIKTVGITTSNVKGGTGGAVLSLLSTNKTFNAGDTFRVQWKLTLLSQ